MACDRCEGSLEAATRTAVDELRGEVELNGVELVLAEAAYRLARAIDGAEGDDRQHAGLNRELRATLKELADLMPTPEDDDGEDTGPR